MRIIRFSTTSGKKTIFFSTAEKKRLVRFTTTSEKKIILFSTVGVGRRKVYFTTRSAFKRISFYTGGIAIDGLQVSFSAAGNCLIVKMPVSYQQGPYQLTVESSKGRTQLNPQPGFRSYYEFHVPIKEDGVLYLSAAKTTVGAAVELASVALVNTNSLRQLAKLGKRRPRCKAHEFFQLSYYCGQAIILYEASEFEACQQMLDLIRDTAPCLC